ncbi:MAG: hypothetical protein Q8R55_06690 [Candidatus Taylorbacteria bacterium]|nr:hypothetical protein [Candidatus Taylorbacteria bacterium]
MSTKDKIIQLLNYAINAPSGGNSQPWTFKISDNKLTILSHPEKDNPVLNFRSRGTLIAQGALIENIIIAASYHGLEAVVNIAKNPNDQAIAEITFSDSHLSPDPLYSSIQTRSTNRKQYKDKAIPKGILTDISNTANALGGSMVNTSFTDDKSKMVIAGKAASNNEVIMLENKVLHNLFFKEVIWNSREEKIKGGSGLYIKTLELKKPQEIVFRIIRHWPMMAVLKKIGLAKFIASENAKIYGTGGAMGAISVNGSSHENFITAGRVLERIWLSYAKEGLSLQLMTGILFMWQKITAGDTDAFSPGEVSLIKTSYDQISSAFNIKGGIITLMFRVGYSEKPSAFSYKKEPIIITS